MRGWYRVRCREWRALVIALRRRKPFVALRRDCARSRTIAGLVAGAVHRLELSANSYGRIGIRTRHWQQGLTDPVDRRRSSATAGAAIDDILAHQQLWSD